MPVFLMLLMFIGILGLVFVMPWTFIWSINVLFVLVPIAIFSNVLFALRLIAIFSNSHIKKS